MSRSNRLLTRRTTIGALLSAPFLFLLGKRANDLAAEPSGAKVLTPLSPTAATVDLPLAQVEAETAAVQLPWAQLGGTINDASHLNQTAVYGIVRVTTEEEIAAALRFARDRGLKVSPAGVRHSMGGQAFIHDGLVLDMIGFNAMTLDAENRLLTVQSGATWHAIQNFLHPAFAVKAMQSSDIFSVGGSISVNAHGMDHTVGALGKTVRSLRLMQADGTVVRLSREENPELFWLVIGGYGLFGIVLDAVLEVTDNGVYEPGRRVIDYRDFPALFEEELVHDPRLRLFYGHLSTAPQSFLQELILYTYTEVDATDAVIPPLGEVSSTRLRRFVLNLSKLGGAAMRLKWFAEKHIEPAMEACSVTRREAMAEAEVCMVSRNEPMHDSVAYLQNNLRNETDILHEYFIPRSRFVEFVDGLRTTLTKHEANLLNASVRVVHAEENFLTYAPHDAYSVVLYINQRADEAGNAKMAALTRALIDLTIGLGGRFFLPYQLAYTREQLAASYPEIDAFFAAKRRYDPDLRFMNTLFATYAL